MPKDDKRKTGQDRVAGPTSKRSRKRRTARATAIALVVVFISLAICAVLCVTVVFKVQTIKVTGASTYTAETVVLYSGIQKGNPLFLLNEKKLQDKLSVSLPFIDKVSLDKKFDGTLTIRITETTESLCYKIGDKFFSADLSGKVINELSDIDKNLVLVTLPETATANIGKKIVFANDREQKLYEKHIANIDKYGAKIDFINVSDVYESYLKIDGHLVVKFGSESYFEEKTSYLKSIILTLNRDETGIIELSSWTPENNQPRIKFEDISKYTY